MHCNQHTAYHVYTLFPINAHQSTHLFRLAAHLFTLYPINARDSPYYKLFSPIWQTIHATQPVYQNILQSDPYKCNAPIHRSNGTCDRIDAMTRSTLIRHHTPPVRTRPIMSHITPHHTTHHPVCHTSLPLIRTASHHISRTLPDDLPDPSRPFPINTHQPPTPLFFSPFA